MTNFTKLIFCLFTILIIFTSCGDGTTNSGHSDIIDNPQFEKSVLDSITVKTLPTKTQYSVGETLDPTGLVLQGNYIDYFSDGSTQTSKRDIDYNTYKNELAFSPTNLSTEGSINITVTYNKKSTTFNITVGKSLSDSKYPSWFKSVSIGGNENYNVFYIDNDAYNEYNITFTKNEKINDYLAAYIDYINGLDLNKNLIGDVENNLKNIIIKGYSAGQKFDLLIGTTADDTGLIYSEVNGINDICAPAIEEIITNVGSGDTAALHKAYFALYYRAIANEAYRNGYNGELTTKNQSGIYNTTTQNQQENKYNKEKNKCIELYGDDSNLPFNNKYFYDETGNLNPEVVQQFNTMVITAATKLGVSENEVRDIVNLSFTASAIEGTHDQLSAGLLVNEHKHTDACCNNEMINLTDSIGFPEISKMTQPAKLNKSIFSQNFGRELC